MPPDPGLLVVGGGHAGLLLALAAERAGVDVAVLDPFSLDADAPADGRCLALLAGSRAAIEGLGVWWALEGGGVPVRAMIVAGGSDRPVAYRAADLDGRDFAHGFESAALRNRLAAAVRARPRIRRHRGRLAGLARDPGGIEARLDDGTALRARLVVGADGRGSQVRRLAGIGVESRAYGQSALCFSVAHARDHRRRGYEWLRPDGPLALLPVAEGRTGVTWVEPEAKAGGLAALPENELLERLDAETGGVLGAARIDTPVAVFPLGVQHARRYAAPRIALVGDAAHGVHPVHAQGFNMGVGDVAALVALLRGRPGDPGAADLLKRYERERWRANAGRILMTDGLVRVFTGAPPLRLAGRAALGLVGAVPPLKRLAIAHGMQLGRGASG
ncbi:MAG: FAD-dependent monooxygenase [Geminicoccaceae bacterium]|nr:FAD-dependent monooxygenase [Geminicoccaceae bacterium]